MDSDTGWDFRSTRRRGLARIRPVHWRTGFLSPSNPGYTWLGRAASGSRTRSSSAQVPGRRDRLSRSPPSPGNCSSFRRGRGPTGPSRSGTRAHAGDATNVATTNDLKNGMTLNIDGQLWNVVEFQHVKPGKGGAFVRTKLKNVMSGKVVDRTFNAGVKVDVANVDKREMQYLYREGEDFVFMDTQDYDQPRIPAATVGDAASYLLEEQMAVVAFNDGVQLYVELPAAVELTVRQTDPGLQGDRSTGGTKPATLETGAQIQVPLFITTGEKLRVDTRTGDYLGRA